VSSAEAHSPRILIVDDEVNIRIFADRALRSAGYQTRMASNGAEALRVSEAEGPFDLLLTDVSMPGMFGNELARRVRVSHPDHPVLYLTGFSGRLFAEKKTLWEHEAFVDKPTTMDGLREAVSLILFGHTQGPASAA
jgi:CheY-like chemotaxis protein